MINHLLNSKSFSFKLKKELIDSSLRIVNRDCNSIWNIKTNELERRYYYSYADTIDYVQSLKELDYITLTRKDEKRIKTATEELHQMFFNTTKYVLGLKNIAKQFNTTEENWKIIKENITRTHGDYFYGRMDLGCDFDLKHIKIFEYNTGLCGEIYDTAIFQKKLFEHFYQGKYKKNTISSGDILLSTLGKRWKELSEKCNNKTVYFFCTEHKEENIVVKSILTGLDLMNIPYKLIIHGKGIRYENDILIDEKTSKKIDILYKTAPWYSIFNPNDSQSYFKCFFNKSVKVIEPMWKTVMGNKALLPYVTKLYPNHPLLLACSFDPNDKCFEGEEYLMEKGLQGRGSMQTKKLLRKSITQSKSGVIYQKIFKENYVNNSYFIMGSFIVGPKYGGFLIKKSDTMINDYTCNVIPVRILKH